MATTRDLTAILLEMVQQSPGCEVEELTARCQGVTWNQVFLVLDGLSRSGQVTLRQQGLGRYQVGLAPQRPAGGQVSSHHQL